MRNAAKMFSFDPNPTTARKAWSSSICLLYEKRGRIIAIRRNDHHMMKTLVQCCGCRLIRTNILLVFSSVLWIRND